MTVLVLSLVTLMPPLSIGGVWATPGGVVQTDNERTTSKEHRSTTKEARRGNDAARNSHRAEVLHNASDLVFGPFVGIVLGCAGLPSGRTFCQL